MIISIVYPHTVNCQQVNMAADSYSDTTIVKDSLGECTHIKLISEKKDIDYRMNFENNLFNDRLNKHTRLIYKSKFDSFNIPTAPLSHLYILREKGIILGLSSYENSTYNVLIYSFSGKLLLKRSLNPVALNLTKNDLKYLIQVYPRFKTFITNETPFVLKRKDSFYIETSHQMITHLSLNRKRDRKNIIVKTFGACRYFPERLRTSSNQVDFIVIDDKEFYRFKSHTQFFNLDNPLVDLIMDIDIPYVLILRDYKNEIVNIPLVSNCDILSELGLK